MRATGVSTEGRGHSGSVTDTLHLDVRSATVLRFDDGAPVRAASAVAAWAGGWLVVQDDATHGAWWRDGSVERVRLLPAVEGHEVFGSADGTKHLKPDLEVAVPVPGGVLLLGSGSTSARMRAALLTEPGAVARTADLAPLYARVTAALGLDPALLNLEGGCLVGSALRWFSRGSADLPSASVDVDLPALLACFDDPSGAADVPLAGPRRYDLGAVDGVALAVTDALALPGGRVLVSAAAEDTPNPYDDGPVVGTALALLDDDGVLATARLPEVRGAPVKVEGIAPRQVRGNGLELLAVADADDPEQPSAALVVDVRWDADLGGHPGVRAPDRSRRTGRSG